MIFVGFGFLMCFIHSMQWTTLCFNWIISAWALQIAILTGGFWHNVWSGHWKKVHVNFTSLILADFGAGAAMITFGALIGKCNLFQLLFLIFWQMIWFAFNEAVCVYSIGITDMGGSMIVHAFGAYYGLAASYFFQPNRAANSGNLKSGYSANIFAMIGSIFLWMYWPSFNGALATEAQQQRVFVNTVLSIASSCIAAAFISRVFYSKLEMEIMLNATLAGGVAIGSSCDLITKPWITMAIGFFSGLVSSIGFKNLGPYLSQHINLQDTCGVNSLHGIPGIIGALMSVLVCSNMGQAGWPNDYLNKGDYPGQATK